MDGILNLLKPAGMTSHDCVAVIRRKSGQRKVGHTGTLDPNACGVLPLCLGQATRVIEYMESAEKAYRCEALLGIETDTQDIWGKVLEDRRERVGALGETAVREALFAFLGSIAQRPPAYSAVKVEGRRLYSYAREGISVTVAERPASIHTIQWLGYDGATGRLRFDIRCSRGTYVRTLCHDLGQILGTGACMSFLLRTRTSGLELKDARTLEDVLEMDAETFAAALLPPASGLRDLARLQLDKEQASLFVNGNPLFSKGLGAEQEGMPDPRTLAVFHQGMLLGIAGYTKEKGYQVRKVLK